MEEALTFIDQDQDKALRARQSRVKTLVISSCIALVIISLIGLSLFWAIRAKEGEILETIEKRLQTLATGKSEVVSTWIAGIVSQSDRIIHSELFGLFAADIDHLGKDISHLITGRALQAEGGTGNLPSVGAQLPMMQRLLEEFTSYSEFMSSRLFNREGQAYLSTKIGTAPISRDYRQIVRTVISGNRPHITPATHTKNGLIMEFFLPVLSPQTDKPVAVLLLEKAVSKKINALLATSPLMGHGERTRLIQKGDKGFQELVPWLPDEMNDLTDPRQFDFTGDIIPFAVRYSRTDSETAYSYGRKVPELDWWIIFESDYVIARKTIKHFIQVAVTVSVLLVLISMALLGAVWWRLVGIENRKSAQRCGMLATGIERQRRLLSSINDTIDEYIAFKDVKGVYQYANPAFADAVGRDVEEIAGLDDTALFGFDASRRLENSDRWVVRHKRSKTISIDLDLQSIPHHLRISKKPFLDENDKFTGIVIVCRDETEAIDVRNKSQHAVRQSMNLLVEAIEKKDPGLSAHSQLTRRVASGIAKELHLDEHEISNIEMAANISQIGKFFVDKELLDKADELGSEERKQMEHYVEQAAGIFGEAVLDMPVAECVCEMNDLIDGRCELPERKETEISMTSRILAVANVFCDMVDPLSCRPSVDAEKAISHLEAEKDKYDADVVEAMAKVARSVSGEMPPAQQRGS